MAPPVIPTPEKRAHRISHAGLFGCVGWNGLHLLVDLVRASRGQKCDFVFRNAREMHLMEGALRGSSSLKYSGDCFHT